MLKRLIFNGLVSWLMDQLVEFLQWYYNAKQIEEALKKGDTDEVETILGSDSPGTPSTTPGVFSVSEEELQASMDRRSPIIVDKKKRKDSLH